MRNTCIDVIPLQLGIAAFAQCLLNVRVELAEIMKGGGVDARLDQPVAERDITMVSSHRLGPLPRALDDVRDMLGIGLRLAARQAGRMRE